MSHAPINLGTEGEIRTLESSLEDSHVSSYITSAMALPAGLEPAYSTVETSRSFQLSHRSEKLLVGEDRVELSPRVPKTRMLALHHTPMNGGTERTRTVIGLVDNQVPHLSATVPYELGGSKGVEPSYAAVTVRCSTIELQPT